MSHSICVAGLLIFYVHVMEVHAWNVSTNNYVHVYRWFIDPASITKEATLHQNVATSIHHLH